MDGNNKIRLDLFLFQNGWVRSRNEAQEIIKQNNVKVNGVICNNSSKKVNKDYKIEIIQGKKYVSRSGYKLEAAVEYCKLNLKDKVCLDIGSSTGGFTQVLLENGAKKVYAIDVGSDQFDKKLLAENFDRITLKENTDIRTLEQKDFEDKIDFIVCDVSFISVKNILGRIQEFSQSGGEGLVLIKPQFEVGKGNTNKGIVTDASLRDLALRERIEDFENAGLAVIDSFTSAITGGDGNVEYFIYFKKN
jgi:23S rRNA (cytidine1920-2'-O)/16S rRNA (cytidine1409-2'-O)-methyltransferase